MGKGEEPRLMICMISKTVGTLGDRMNAVCVVR